MLPCVLDTKPLIQLDKKLLLILSAIPLSLHCFEMIITHLHFTVKEQALPQVHVSYFVNKTLPPESSPILNLFMDIFYARHHAESKDYNNRTGHFQSYTDGTRLKSH